jgi:hypothetical protein
VFIRVACTLMVIALSLMFSISCALAAESVEEQWSRTYGGSWADYGYSVRQTSDGGYIMAGVTASHGAGSADVWLIKTDGDGKTQWDKTFGESGEDRGYCVQQTSDGGYVITGETQSYGAGLADAWLIKTDSDGKMQWDKTFGDSGEDRGYWLQQTSDGGYIMTGETQSYGAGLADAWLIKTDGDGNMQWDKTFGGTSKDYGRSVQQTSDGGYIIAGETRSYGAGLADVWLIKTDSEGNKEWDNTFGGASEDYGRSVQQAPDNSYVVAGGTESLGAGEMDVWLARIDPAGNELWATTFGGSGSDGASCLEKTADGGYMIAGYKAGDKQADGAVWADMWLIVTDPRGNLIWQKSLGGPYADYGSSVQQTADGGYIAAGLTVSYGAGNADAWLVELRHAGTQGMGVRQWVGVGFAAAGLASAATLVLGRRILGVRRR